MSRVFPVACLLLWVACSGRSAGTSADAAVSDAAPDAEVDYCPLDVTGTADASGHTPLGPIDAPLAWVGIFGGECGGMRVALVPDRQIFEPLLTEPFNVDLSGAADALVLWPQNYDHDNGGWINTGPLTATHYVAGQTVEATGLITITEFTDWPAPDDPPDERVLFATFVVDAPGWSVSGWIEAVRCIHLDILCP